MFTLTISTGNAAFSDPDSEEDSIGAAAREVARMLRDAAAKLEDGTYSGGLRDANGNTAGRFDLT